MRSGQRVIETVHAPSKEKEAGVVTECFTCLLPGGQKWKRLALSTAGG